MWGHIVPQPPKPEPEPDPEDEDLTDRLRAFDQLGFDHWTAFALAWNDYSPADIRERLLKHGATHEQVARILL